MGRYADFGVGQWRQGDPSSRHVFGQTGVRACAEDETPLRPGPALGLERMLTDAVSYYEQGADGIALWDAAGRDIRSWSVLSRFGRPDEMRARIKSGIPPESYVFFRRLGDNIMNGRFSPIWGG